MKRLHSLTLAAALALLSVAGYGQIPISSVPYTITSPGTYVLANDLSYSFAYANGITIKSSKVTLDFAGHALTYTDNFSNLPSNSTGHVVENMRITLSHEAGVQLYCCSGCSIQNNHIDNSFYPNSAGVYITASPGNPIVVGNEPPGGNRVVGNHVLNCYAGIASTGHNYLESNFVCNCSVGFDMSPTDKYRSNTTVN